MGVINTFCCKSKQNSFEKYDNIDTIRLEEDSISNTKKNQMSKERIMKKKKSYEILNDSTDENKKNQNLYEDKKQTNKSEKPFVSKVSNQSNQNRRKSISISINQLNQLTNKYTNHSNVQRRGKKSRSTMNYNRTYDLSNFKFKYKEIYNKLPAHKISAKKMIKLNEEEINDKKKVSISLNNSESISTKEQIQDKNNKNHHSEIEEILEPYTEKQINTLKHILLQEELIINEMDDATINLIINTTSYIRVKSKVIIFSKENPSEDFFYMIEKGTLNYSIDGDIYELHKLSGIGTSALIKNCKENCYLISVERCYLFKLPIEKYKKIAEEFYINLHNLKIEILNSHFFF